jgi:hypothetical protein
LVVGLLVVCRSKALCRPLAFFQIFSVAPKDQAELYNWFLTFVFVLQRFLFTNSVWVLKGLVPAQRHAVPGSRMPKPVCSRYFCPFEVQL